MKSDNDLQHEIRNQLVLMLSHNAEKLDIQVREGVVTLTGNVGSNSEQWDVEDAVRRMPGVRSTVNDLFVVPVDAPVRGADGDTAQPWFPST